MSILLRSRSFLLHVDPCEREHDLRPLSARGTPTIRVDLVSSFFGAASRFFITSASSELVWAVRDLGGRRRGYGSGEGLELGKGRAILCSEDWTDDWATPSPPAPLGDPVRMRGNRQMSR